jgi:hypothetical protein
MTVDEFQLEFIRQIRSMYTEEDLHRPVTEIDAFNMMFTLTVLAKAVKLQEG